MSPATRKTQEVGRAALPGVLDLRDVLDLIVDAHDKDPLALTKSLSIRRTTLFFMFLHSCVINSTPRIRHADRIAEAICGDLCYVIQVIISSWSSSAGESYPEYVF